ncbi:MAG: hypothetical protein QM679_03925 [Patulibacter sp.]
MSVRVVLLPVLALALVSVVLAVQAAAGGGRYRVAALPSACAAAPPALPSPDNFDEVTQAVVLDGVRRAACELGTSREALLVALPSSIDRAALAARLGVSDAVLLEQLRSGLLESVVRLDRADALPATSTVVDDFAEQLGLGALGVAAVRQIPAGVIDELLPPGDTLRRAITSVDLPQLLGSLDDASSIQAALVPAIRDAVLAEAQARLMSRLDDLGSLLGLG